MSLQKTANEKYSFTAETGRLIFDSNEINNWINIERFLLTSHNKKVCDHLRHNFLVLFLNCFNLDLAKTLPPWQGFCQKIKYREL